MSKPLPSSTLQSAICNLHFSVRDTGIGIPAEKLQAIFEPFIQADSSTTRQYGGTGLGLTITTRLLERMGGRLQVESAVGQGSTFHFTLALEVPACSPSRLLPRRPPDLADVPVLVVDDNATNRRILEELLVSWRMKPAAAEDGAAALAELERAADQGQAYPLALLDACMPGMDGFALAAEVRRRPHLTAVSLLMLSSADRQGDAARCRELGIPLYLTKPIKQSDLQEGILQVLGLLGPPSAPTEAAPAPLPGASLRVLLAEDNLVNQRLAVAWLHKLGHEVVVADNGAAAVRAAEQQAFDLILMDVQMPEMGGFEATAAIRARERASGRRVPILALTARAMKGDREECLRAGMDGYLSKPIRPEHLDQAIAEVTRAGQVGGTAGLSGPHPPTLVDPKSLRDRLGDDPTLLREMAGLFQADAPRLLEQVRVAVARGDAPGLFRAAHTLKGAVSTFALDESFQAAERLEAMGRTGDLAAAGPAYHHLTEALARFQATLREWLAAQT